jgi:hypothetical protein
MEIIKHKSCNNKVKLLIIPTYSITNSKTRQQYNIFNKLKKNIDFRNEICLP